MTITHIPVDLHCHSNNSDGVFSVTDLLDMVKNNGGKYIALTDHDTVIGVAEARKHAKQIGLHLIGGVEISVTWRNNILIHIIGLNVDETNAALVNRLNELRKLRLARGEAIAAGLAKVHIPNALEGAMRYCDNPNSLSRTHFARFLVAEGYAKKGKVFDKYMVAGRPGYVNQTWATLEEAVSLIVGSGGVAVIAHPCRYKLTRMKLLELIADFKQYGGSGIEVISSSHSPDDVKRIAAIAACQGLLCSIGTDFHNVGENFQKINVGLNPPLPANCMPIFEKIGITDTLLRDQ